MAEVKTDDLVARFDPFFRSDLGERITASMAQDSDGYWVRYEDFERLQDALKDIALGASMMLDSPPMAALHKYAAEVRRVANLALCRSKTELEQARG